MKGAISTDGEFVSAHFGRCPLFTLVDIENGKMVKKEVIANPGHEPGFLPEFLRKKGVTHIIAGGMGQRALIMFEQSGIKPVLGISGKIDNVIKELEQGTLKTGESLCHPGDGKGYGVEKTLCDHPHED
ncbi:MAG: NifB/NifX family molybdenum-iron cluster-binding protein [Endomicrobiaceae bacterium]|nr:NifB/NifX family molybdenum-iron cluster-binding protein [Endomicrobiaceae bacterium]